MALEKPNARSFLAGFGKTNTRAPTVDGLVCPRHNTATFTLHIRNIVERARDKIGWVLRVFQSRERSLILALLKSLVIPLLEDCCQLWNPWKAKDIQPIEAEGPSGRRTAFSVQG